VLAQQVDAGLTRCGLDRVLQGLVVGPADDHALALEQDEPRRADGVEHDHVGPLARQLVLVALDERGHALFEGLLRAGRDEQHADAGDRLGGQTASDLEHRCDRAEVVVRARDDGTAADVGHRRGRAQRQGRPGGPHPAQPEQRAERDEQRAGEDELHRAGPDAAAVDQLRERPRVPAHGPEVEGLAGVRGVVMRDDADDALGVRVTRAADDVPRRALGQQAARPVPAPQAALVPDAERAEPSEQRGEQAPAGGEQASERAERGEDADRPPVRAVGALLLDVGVEAELAQLARDPLRGEALAL
jgi:hypothetical protein